MAKAPSQETPQTHPGERIAKRIAAAGICSRREAERLIDAGKVAVNGQIIDSPALNVTAEDSISVSGKTIEAQAAPRLWLYHKPAGLVTTHSDPEGRQTVFDAISKELPRVISVGRLDLSSEGLLLLTNNGGLARLLELPSTGLERHYRARVYGHPPPQTLERLANGITIDGIYYAPLAVALERSTNSHAWLNVTLTEGKNREIRKIFEHLGFPVGRLIRTAYGPFELGSLKAANHAEVAAKQWRAKLAALGISLDKN